MTEDEKILLKIKRQFTKDESIAALNKIISELKLEIGILKSENAELKDILDSRTVDGKPVQVGWLKDDVVKNLENRLKIEKKLKEQLQKSVNEFRDKFYSLVALNDSKKL